MRGSASMSQRGLLSFSQPAGMAASVDMAGPTESTKGDKPIAESSDYRPVWFITGCSTGFGRAFARQALAHGFRVAATARDPKTLDDLVEGHRGNAIAPGLDVTDSSQIAGAVSEAVRAFGRIDVLVNNAGYGYLAAIE